MTVKKPVYLDYAAATPMDPRAVAAMLPYFSEKFYNPGATYSDARQASSDLAQFRARIAHWIGARPTEVLLLAGATEANNLAIQGIMQQHPGSRLIITGIEHPSVMEPAAGCKHIKAPVTHEGMVDIDKLRGLIDQDTTLISIMYANNEIGTIQPLKQVAQLISTIRKDRRNSGHELPLYLHTDASQAACYLDIHASRLGVDMMTVNGGKIYGPKQSGILYVRSGIELQPLLKGGGQERGLRSGTESLPQIAGLSMALDIVQVRRRDETVRLKKLQDLFLDLLEAEVPSAIVNGSRKHRLPNNIHITMPGQSSERLIIELDQRGIQCAAGSACSASSTKASSVLAALGLDETAARSSLRFTMGTGTTEEHIRYTVSELAALANRT